MVESSWENSDKMIIGDRQGREYRLQVNEDKDSCFIAKLLYRNSEVGNLQCVLYAPDNIMSGRLTSIKILPPATNRNESNH